MAEGSSKKRITVTVKTPKEKENIECDEDETVEKVKSISKFPIFYLFQMNLEIARKTVKWCLENVNTLVMIYIAAIIIVRTSRNF